MTESEWLTSADPQAALAFVRDGGKLTDREARLFAGACGRAVWRAFEDGRSRRAVEVAERLADGRAEEEEREAAYEAAHDAAFNGMVAGYAAAAALYPEGLGAAECLADPAE